MPYEMIKAFTVDKNIKDAGFYFIRCKSTGRYVSNADGERLEFDFVEAKEYLAGPAKIKIPIKDIRASGLQMPDVVYIVGSGVKGREHYKQIPATAYVIAVNKAVTIAEIKPSCWVVLDPDTVKTGWFKAASKAFGGIRIFSEEAGEGFNDPAKQFTFKLCAPTHGAWEPDKTGVRVGGTVGSAAVEIAAMCGAKHIILCGFDLSGDEYFDGEIRKDERHGKTWQARDLFDNTIEYYQRKGILIETLSETKLRKPTVAILEAVKANGEPTTLPAVAYCCFTFDPIDRMNAIIDAINQDYPPELKTIYLLRQRNYGGEFPPRIKHNFPIRIVEIDVEGEWPDLWTLKLMAFCEIASEPVTMWWDEDDRYPPDYTIKAVDPIIKGHPLCWNYDCAVVQNGMIWDYFYRSPIGTLVIKTAELKTIAKQIYNTDYEAESSWRSPKRLSGEPVGGARDNTMKRHIEKIYDPIMHHTGYKYYFIHGQSNTCGDRPDEKNVDYKPDGGNVRLWRTTTK